METLYLIIFFIFGSIMGSFYHVIATRLSKGKSIITPASHCEKCNHQLKWYELIPIISYIIQGALELRQTYNQIIFFLLGILSCINRSVKCPLRYRSYFI